MLVRLTIHIGIAIYVSYISEMLFITIIDNVWKVWTYIPNNINF